MVPDATPHIMYCDWLLGTAVSVQASEDCAAGMDSFAPGRIQPIVTSSRGTTL